MMLRGLWGSWLFLNVATGATPSAIQFAVYPLAMARGIGLARGRPRASLPA